MNQKGFRVLTNPMPPLCKGRDALRKQASGLFLAKAGRGSDLGRWIAEGETEGLCNIPKVVFSRINPTANVDNPSVSFADSSLYTREPWVTAFVSDLNPF